MCGEVTHSVYFYQAVEYHLYECSALRDFRKLLLPLKPDKRTALTEGTRHLANIHLCGLHDSGPRAEVYSSLG